MGAQVRKQRSGAIELSILKPVLRAYALGFCSSAGPRLFGFIRLLRRKDITSQEKWKLLLHILYSSSRLNRFPASCAIIVGGATLLPRLLKSLFQALFHLLGRDASFLSSALPSRSLRFVSSFASAWLAFNLLNRDDKWTRRRAQSRGFNELFQNSPNQHHLPPSAPPRYAGKTIDLTLFSLTRALDLLVVTVWLRTRSRALHPERQFPRLFHVAKKFADPAIFASSAAVIMHAWFYSPERLPVAYNHWISQAASIDQSLIQALRLVRQGDWIYGTDTGQADLLRPLCRNLNLPEKWADPAQTIPIPCEIVHMGTGPSCEFHALTRFTRTFRFAMEMYLPLQLVFRLRVLRSSTWLSIRSQLLSALRAAAQSSAFLGAFVACFYYAVCLARTRLGPRLFPPTSPILPITPQMWDGGLDVLAGCLLCGWSILLEQPRRRQEIAFFVAPRALATLLPRVYDEKYRWRERVIFAASVATVMTSVGGGAAAQRRSRNQHRVRGVLGNILAGVMKE